MELKAKDAYRCEVLETLDQGRLISLMSLYQPLVGCAGVSLYLTLYSEAKHQRSFELHGRLCQIMNMDILVLEQARKKLEEMLLLRSYYKTNDNKDQYLYVLGLPLSPDRFFQHEVFGRLYAKLLGAKQYQQTLSKLKHIPFSSEGFTDISEEFKSNFMENWDEDSEMQFSRISPKYNFETNAHPEIKFDYERFLTRATNLIFPIEARTKENLQLIGELATMYGISADQMLILVGRSTSNDNNNLSSEKLRSLAFMQKQKTPEKTNPENPYDLSPLAFLQSKQNGLPVTDNDKRIVEMLIGDLKMNPQVANVLLEYVLKISDNRLVRPFVESVGASWIRNHVDSLEKAQQAAKQTITKRTTTNQRKDILPEYYQEVKQGTTQKKEAEIPFNNDEMTELRRKLKEQEG